MSHRSLTMVEAAKELHKKRRWLQAWLARHPTDASGNPYYTPVGRTKILDDNDLARIRAALREEERCRLNSLTPGRAKRRTTRVEARTEESTLNALRSLLRSKKQKSASLDGNEKSNVVSMTRSQPNL